MNREQAKKLLPIIEALANGEAIQIKESSGKWATRTWDHFNFDSNAENYRVKPKPRECWVTVCGGDTISSAFRHKEEAESVLNGAVISDRDNWEIVKFIEVTDETDM